MQEIFLKFHKLLSEEILRFDDEEDDDEPLPNFKTLSEVVDALVKKNK
jgi:hypothetical protein